MTFGTHTALLLLMSTCTFVTVMHNKLFYIIHSYSIYSCTHTSSSTVPILLGFMYVQGMYVFPSRCHVCMYVHYAPIMTT